MRDNGAAKQVGESATESLAPNSDVLGMARHAVGSVLEGTAEARDKIRAAKQLHDMAKSVGDHEVEAMMKQELRSLRTAARIAP